MRKIKTKTNRLRDAWAHLREARRLLLLDARQARADQKTDGLDRSEYIRRLRSEAAKLPRKPKSNRKGEPL